jgi:hypothetical protein
MTLEDFNALGVGDEAELVTVYGSLEAAHDRCRHLWDSGQLRTNPGTRPEAFWIFDGPEYLRAFDTWLEVTGIAPPRTPEEWASLDTDFNRARARWLEQQRT